MTLEDCKEEGNVQPCNFWRVLMLFFWEAGVVHEEIWVRRNTKELAAVVIFNGWGLTVETHRYWPGR